MCKGGHAFRKGICLNSNVVLKMKTCESLRKYEPPSHPKNGLKKKQKQTNKLPLLFFYNHDFGNK